MTKRTPRKRYRQDPLAPASDPIPNAMEIWHALAPLDETARMMEQKWGIERLPCLVSEQTAAKFGAAREHLDALLGANDEGAGDVGQIAAACANLRKGWLALDAEATAAGATAFDPIGWSMMVDGHPCVIVRDPAAAGHIQAQDRHRTVYTLEEIANIVGAFRRTKAWAGVEEAKAAFPGAAVSVGPPRSELGKAMDDEIPF